jgi:hypothetical protein
MPSVILPAIVMPLHDADAILADHLGAIAPGLSTLFEHAYLGITRATRRAYGPRLDAFNADPFFRLLDVDDAPVGDQFGQLYRFASDAADPDQLLHLAFPDRVTFGLRSEYAPAFAADMVASAGLTYPLLYERSAMAWATHPANYQEIEGFLTRVGELLLGRSLDFAWCHLAVPAGRLAGVLPHVRARDMSMLAEIVLGLGNDLQTQAVDWLAWEDPLVLGVDAGHLRAARNVSPQEARKRLSYVLPMIERLLESES